MRINTRTNRRLIKEYTPTLIIIPIILMAVCLIKQTDTEPTYQQCLNQWRTSHPTIQEQQCSQYRNR